MRFRRGYGHGREPWDRSQRRFRQAEYEDRYAGELRRARPGERGLGWARQRDIEDSRSQQAAPQGRGRYDRTGEEQYAEGLERFEHDEYAGPGYGDSHDWELDQGGVQFGTRGMRRGRYGGDRFGEEAYGYGPRGGGYGGYGGYAPHAGFRGEAFGGEERGYRGLGPRGYQRSDERIREDVCDCLTDDDYIDATDIEVKVQSGVVTLTGTVPSRSAKRRAEDIIEDLPGVREVENQLRVQPSQAGAGAGAGSGFGERAAAQRSALFGGSGGGQAHGSGEQAYAGGQGAAAGTTQRGGTTGEQPAGSKR